MARTLLAAIVALWCLATLLLPAVGWAQQEEEGTGSSGAESGAVEDASPASGEGTPATDPAEGPPAADPAEGTPAADPAEGTPATDPAAGTPTIDPAAPTPLCDPVVSGECEPPVLQLPVSFTVDAAGNPEGVPVEFAVFAVDAVDPMPVVACDRLSGSVFVPGVATVTCTATDSAGNTASGSFTVTVDQFAAPDLEPPVLQVPAPFTVDAGSPAGVTLQLDVTAVDAVDPTPVVVCDPLSGSVFVPGVTTVTCTATDASGNVSPPGSFTVTVNAPPVLPPDAPDANDDSLETVQGVPLQIAYLANDVDPSATATTRVESQPANGAIAVAPGLFTYTPNGQFVGTDSFTYGLCGALPDAVCDSATVTIRVLPAGGATTTALADPTWQAMSQRQTASDGIPDNCKGALAWGGYANGQIPPAAMVSIGSPQVLEREAGTQFLAMRAASEQAGVSLPLTDSYRSYQAQVDLRARKGAIVATATPGTSVHGWGKAIDINLGASPGLQSWLEQNSVRFGWVNPTWARRPGKSFEPWHYEYFGGEPATGGGVCAPVTTAATAATVQDAALSAPVPAPGTSGAPEVASEPVGGFSLTSFLARARNNVAAVAGFVALVVAAVTARLAIKEFRSRDRGG